MNEKLQTFDAIKASGRQGNDESRDPVKKEYQDGLGFLQKQEFGQAAVAFHNALVEYEQRQDQAGIANASNQLGHLCLMRQEYEAALKHYLRVRGVCENANDRMSVIAVLQKIVAAHKGLKQYDEAIAACLDMLDQYHDNRDPQGTVVTLETIAEIYLEAGNKEKAGDTFRTIGSIHKNFRHDSLAAKYFEKAAGLQAPAD